MKLGKGTVFTCVSARRTNNNNNNNNENNKVIIVDIVSPWDHRVHEREGEKLEKYHELKREIKNNIFYMGDQTCRSHTDSCWCTWRSK